MAMDRVPGGPSRSVRWVFSYITSSVVALVISWIFAMSPLMTCIPSLGRVGLLHVQVTS